MGTRPEFGATLRRLRHQQGLTLRDVASRVGIDFTYLSKIENGHDVTVSEATIVRLAHAINADDPEALVFLSGKIPERVKRYLLSLDPYNAAGMFRNGEGADA